jgi:hypothetical protein
LLIAQKAMSNQKKAFSSATTSRQAGCKVRAMHGNCHWEIKKCCLQVQIFNLSKNGNKLVKILSHLAREKSKLNFILMMSLGMQKIYISALKGQYHTQKSWSSNRTGSCFRPKKRITDLFKIKTQFTLYE